MAVKGASIRNRLRQSIRAETAALKLERLDEEERRLLLAKAEEENEKRRALIRERRRESRQAAKLARKKIAEREEAERLARERAAKRAALERKLKPVRLKLRSILEEYTQGAGEHLSVTENPHEYWSATLSVGTRASFVITIGETAGRILPGPKFKTHDELLAYMQGELLQKLARLIAEEAEVAAEKGKHDEIDYDDDEFEEAEFEDDEHEQEWGEDLDICTGSFAPVSGDELAGGVVTCRQCDSSFEESDLIDADAEGYSAKPGVVGRLPSHAPE